MKKSKYPRLSYVEIEKVIIGDAEAINALVGLYMPYITVLSRGGKEIEDRVIARLIKAVMRFSLEYKD